MGRELSAMTHWIDASGCELLQVGSSVAGHRVLRLRPESTRGCIWEVLTPDGQAALLKLYPDAPSGTPAESQVRSSARFLSGLNAPNVARVLDGGLVQDTPFLVLERIEGHNALELASHLGTRGLPSLRASLELVRGVAAGVRAFQRYTESPHGAVSPLHVVVDESGRPVLVDPPLFGERALPTDAADLAFVAPEHDPLAAPTSVDVWGLGALLRWAVSGEAPVRLGRPRRVPDAISGLPREIAVILEATLAPSPSDRVSSVGAVQQLLAVAYDAVEPDAGLRTLAASLPPRSRVTRSSSRTRVATPL